MVVEVVVPVVVGPPVVVVVLVVVVLVVVEVVVGPSVVVAQLTQATRCKLSPFDVGGFGHLQYSSVPPHNAFSRTYPPEQPP